MDYRAKYEGWLNDPYFDQQTKDELRALEKDENEIKERFYKELGFGTAGLRGIIGAGTNRMNRYTVGKATQGLANYIRKRKAEEKGVVIAYDSRRMSKEFARESALCLAANGIRAYVFEDLRPTPELSYAVRKLGCTAGINITASHNPPEYNGYKVYWEDGAQITPPHDKGIMDEVKAITDYSSVKTMTSDAASAKGLYEIIGKELDDSYMEELKKQVIHMEAIQKAGKELCIVYSPLHGTGNIPVRRILRELGFENVHVVKEQELPDGNFPTVSYPNPETEEAFALGLSLAEKVDADLILATDPDADRLGVYVKDTRSGTYRALSGNMSGCLLAEYELSQRAESGNMPKDGFLVKSIVSSNMARAIAAAYDVEFREVLTGFKYIGLEILKSEESKKGTYLFGFEESYGCLIGTYARDKDAVVASMALCEAAAYYKTKGMTLWDAMMDAYQKYGYYKEEVLAVTLAGMEGLEKIQKIMEAFRNEPPAEIGGYKVIKARDYLKGTIRNVSDEKEDKTGLPSSNVLYYDLEEDGWVCVRPSGTEPKIKFYYGIRGTDENNAGKKAADLGHSVRRIAEEMSKIK